MKRPIFSTGQIEYLGNLYQSIIDCGDHNLKEILRACVKRTGLVMDGDSFSAYIEGEQIIVPIGAVVFDDMSIYSPHTTTTLSLDLTEDTIDKYIAVEQFYDSVLPYPIMPEPGSISTTGIHYTLLVPSIKLVTMDTPNPTGTQKIIGQITYNDGAYYFDDMRNEYSMLLIDPPGNTTAAPIISTMQLSVFQLPDLSEVSVYDMPDINVVETYINASWLIPSEMKELQYFTVVAVPYQDNVERWEMATSSQYIPTEEELGSIGPKPRAYVNLRCVPGVLYKVILYGYFNRLDLNKFQLTHSTIVTTDINNEPEELEVILSDLTTTKKSFQITPVYQGPGRMQVFVQGLGLIQNIVDKRFLLYDGPVAPVLCTAEYDRNVKVRIVNSYARVTHESNTLLHQITTSGWISPDEEQWVFTVPCIVDPYPPVSSVSVAEFEAPCDFQITKAVFYLEREVEFAFDHVDNIDITVNSSVILTGIAGISDSYDKVWGFQEQSAPLPSFSDGDTITVEAIDNGSLGYGITPYYGTIILYVKKVL